MPLLIVKYNLENTLPRSHIEIRRPGKKQIGSGRISKCIATCKTTNRRCTKNIGYGCRKYCIMHSKMTK